MVVVFFLDILFDEVVIVDKECWRGQHQSKVLGLELGVDVDWLVHWLPLRELLRFKHAVASMLMQGQRSRSFVLQTVTLAWWRARGNCGGGWWQLIVGIGQIEGCHESKLMINFKLANC